MKRFFYPAIFAAGLAAVCWVAFGYLGSNLLALTMSTLIGAFYVMGTLELRRFDQATRHLGQALAAIPTPLPSLGAWLDKLPLTLQNAVRLRVEGERVGLPGPAMTPYLVGLLVLLGMLGTFLGMVVTLNGAVRALESTTDLQAVRDSLAAPVKGLGLAFGTSVAGVAASAMLGLLSALCRRDRLQVAQVLDSKIARELRVFSLAHQREESFKTLQAQAGAMPAVVEQLQAMMAQLDRQGQALNEQLLSGQQRFHRHAETAYADLASSVDRSLKASLTESARIAGATIQPVVEATMNGIARETGSLHQKVAEQVAAQLGGLSTRFETTVATVAEVWSGALAQHAQTSEHLNRGLQSSLHGFNEHFAERAGALLGQVEQAHGALQRALAETAAATARESALLNEKLAGTVTRQLDGVTTRFASAVDSVSATWRDALAQHRLASEELTGATRESLQAFTDSFEQRSLALLASVDQGQDKLQATQASRDEQRLAAWTGALETMAVALRQEWQQAGEHNLAQQQRIGELLAQSARDIGTQAEAQAQHTLAEIARLMQAAAEAPRAAAEVMDELRSRLSESMARDNGLLEERGRIMATLSSLLDAVNHASGEQRGAIDALVASSAALLERAGAQFGDKVEAESAHLQTLSAQITGSAAEVASLGEAFGFAVGQFSESNQRLMVQLERIESAMDRSQTRSDEQLAYYVAQAREIIDLSITSQKQIVEDLQQLSLRQAPALLEPADAA